AALEGKQVIAATNMLITDPDLRHRTAPAFLHHLRTQGRITINIQLGHLRTLFIQQAPRAGTEPAPAGHVHHDRRHAPLTTGSFSSRHACRPPCRRIRRLKPCFFNTRPAAEARGPVLQARMTGLSLYFSRSARRSATWAAGILMLPAICPSRNSSASRTSRITPSSRLTRWVACCGDTGAPARPDSIRKNSASKMKNADTSR